METINKLITELANIKALQKDFNQKEIACKALLLEALKDAQIEETVNVEQGSVRIQRRSEKDYGEEVRKQESSLKELKKLKDDIGDYEIIKTSENLVFNFPAKS